MRNINRLELSMQYWSRRRDLNSRPPPYHGDALPLSYDGKIDQAIVAKLLCFCYTLELLRATLAQLVRATVL